MSCPIIDVRCAVKRYGEIKAVDEVDLTIEAGGIFGLIGHNGAGKSTLFKMMLGLVRPTAGKIEIDGASVCESSFRRVRRRLGYLPESLALYDNLSGRETMDFLASLKGVSRSACGPLLERVRLSDAADRRVRTYSKGMRQRLGFAQALLGEPALLFLDEPTNGLDPEGTRDFYQILREQCARGATIVITSHVLSEIESRVDRVAIMKLGKVQALGTIAALRAATNLPLRFDFSLVGSARTALDEALAPLGISTARAQERGDRMTIDVPRGSRMDVLQALVALHGRVADLSIQEPSLEDVFLGTTQAHT